MQLTHINEQNNPTMVDVSDKNITKRRALASGKITMNEEAFNAVLNGNAKKGAVINTAIVAAVLAAKQTSNLIPMCHPLPISKVDVDITPVDNEFAFKVSVVVVTEGKTGVEMEALNAVSVGLLTIYDMVKAIDKTMVIDDIKLLEKDGGKSGQFRRN
ncbi:cyclic pyranopterin monophosphate synthase MoaC [Campylobacter sp. Cr9]|uniref:cyclic pyranopterin monophosphate synthase MoaC n=1 Tax=unclassified Campylobacter TaxID=2593542 RepID=UPI001EFAF996|nr:cyclic pyranopterin monophosphate synthase MoaC [Campylobacter sp. RM5004]MBZ7985270.1 cyclic pyranopterin monophosphate synthase MoaC [Campylobacter sp. Cr9]ULO00935.1 cyclic pyranopterin monophosphate synthase [Campylobacter sp. RM5004]